MFNHLKIPLFIISNSLGSDEVFRLTLVHYDVSLLHLTSVSALLSGMCCISDVVLYGVATVGVRFC